MTDQQIERMNLICESLKSEPKNKTQIIGVVELKTGSPYAYSTLKKDIRILRAKFNAPIVYAPTTMNQGSYLIDVNYDFSLNFLRYHADRISFTKQINKILFSYEP